MSPLVQKSLKIIIFFDIDDTLIGDKIGPIKYLQRKIISLKKRGVVFGINTNRPWSEAKKIYKKFFLNGPIICEDGSYYLLNSMAKKISLPGSNHNLRNEVVSFLRNKIYFDDYQIIVSNDKRILSNWTGKNMIFITSARRYSASLYVRKEGKIDEVLTKNIFSIFNKRLKSMLFELVIKNGKINISNNKTSKINALAYISSKYFSKSMILMISDKEKIANRIPGINFCAFFESDQKYKNKCSYISNKGGMHGILDIINNYI